MMSRRQRSTRSLGELEERAQRARNVSSIGRRRPVQELWSTVFDDRPRSQTLGSCAVDRLRLLACSLALQHFASTTDHRFLQTRRQQKGLCQANARSRCVRYRQQGASTPLSSAMLPILTSIFIRRSASSNSALRRAKFFRAVLYHFDNR